MVNQATNIRGPVILLKDSITLLKKNIASLTIIVLMPTILLFLSAIILVSYATYVQNLTNPTFDKRFMLFGNATTIYRSDIPYELLILISCTLLFFGLVWTQVLIYARAIKNPPAASFIEAIRFGFSKILPASWSALLTMVLTSTVVGAFNLLILFALMALTTGQTYSQSREILVIVIFVLMVFSSYCIMLPFSMASYISICENTSGLLALMKSREYMHHRLRAVIWRSSFFIIITSIFLLLLVLMPMPHSVTLFLCIFCTVLFYFLYTSAMYEDLRFTNVQLSFDPTRWTKIAYTVLSIIAILMFVGALWVTNFMIRDSISKQYDLSRLNDVENIRTALKEYYPKHNLHYPASLNELVPIYLKKIPKDPETREEYKYTQTQGGVDFMLCSTWNHVTACYPDCSPYSECRDIMNKP
ncbi:hypothetical protein BH09PAT2_BH09PAT2_04710 [soil metagenome]